MAWKIYGMRIMISQSLKVRMTLLLKCAQRVYVVQSRHDTKMGPYIQGMPFGHEFSGVVDAIGSDVTHVKVGDKVTGCPAIPCYQCEYCLKVNMHDVKSCSSLAHMNLDRSRNMSNCQRKMF